MTIEELYNQQKEKETMLYGSEFDKASPALDTRYIIRFNKEVSLRTAFNLNNQDANVQNANMFLTKEELLYVAKHHPLKEKAIESIMAVGKTNKDGEVETIECKPQFNSVSYSVMALTAIFHLTQSDENIIKVSKNNFVDNRTTLIVDEAMKAYKIPFDKLNVPTTYLKDEMLQYKWTNFLGDISNYIVQRWRLNDNREKNCQRKILEMMFAKEGYDFVIQPAKIAILLAKKEILNGNLERYELKDFLYKMRYGTRDIAIEEIFGDDDEDKDEKFEPYRDEILTKALLSVLVLQFGNSEEFDFSHVNIDGRRVNNDAQLTLFLQGKQGAGKSTFANKMALGYSYDLPKLDSTDQEIVLSRANAVVVELGEGLATSKADVKKMKMEQTKREAHINLKYQNGLTDFVYKSLLVVTANNSDLLKDITGERRNYPIRVTEEQLQLIETEEMLRLYATMYIDIIDGKLDYNLRLKEKEEWLEYKRDLFGQTDASLSILCKWLLNKLLRNEIVYRISKKGNIFIPGRREMQTLINTDPELKGIYADKLLEYLANLPNTKMGIQYNNKGKRLIRMSLKELSVALTDNEETLELRLNGKKTLGHQELLGLAVHTMLMHNVPRKEIVERLSIEDVQIDTLSSLHYDADWFKPESQWSTNDLPFKQ